MKPTTKGRTQQTPTRLFPEYPGVRFVNFRTFWDTIPGARSFGGFREYRRDENGHYQTRVDAQGWRNATIDESDAYASDLLARARFTSGFDKLLPYVRYVGQSTLELMPKDWWQDLAHQELRRLYATGKASLQPPTDTMPKHLKNKWPVVFEVWFDSKNTSRFTDELSKRNPGRPAAPYLESLRYLQAKNSDRPSFEQAVQWLRDEDFVVQLTDERVEIRDRKGKVSEFSRATFKRKLRGIWSITTDKTPSTDR